MWSPDLTRRNMLEGAAAMALASGMAEAGEARPNGAPETKLVWLDRQAPERIEGTTFGVPWPRGAVRPGQSFRLSSNGGAAALQSWPLATWPDGSLKWTAHAVVGEGLTADAYRLEPGAPRAPQQPIRVEKRPDAFLVHSGARTWTVPRQGAQILSSATIGKTQILGPVRLVASCQDHADLESGEGVRRSAFQSAVETAVVEQSGPVRAVIRLEGKHVSADRQWLPFVLRLYFYAGADSVRVVHSFVFDGEPAKDFLSGIGLEAEVPMRDPLYDRHVRFTGAEDGVWGEAVRPVTGLRRDPGQAYREAQVAGRALPALEGMAPQVRNALQWIPAWNDFTLSQTNADGYVIRKRTEAGHTWLTAAAEHRASGLAYVGGASGGVALGMKDFWQRAPTRLDVRDAAGATAHLTAWLWSPEAAMDLRGFRPLMGMDTHAKETEGLNITYEDYEAGWDAAYGIARTSELTLWALPKTPANADLATLVRTLTNTPRLTVEPARLHLAGVFGLWSLPDSSTPAKAKIEAHLTYLVDYYLRQVEQRRWYGFWNYGDVMHTYDADRHVWRYDIGGFAWDNSELSTDMMFWYAYLRTGRADVFRMAEAMTRHTGEVDVYHLGPYRGFGTRHGVLHYSDSSKQPRISNAAYRRFYYYLTADERCGDLMRELIHSEDTLQRVDISRKLDGAAERPKLPQGVVDCGFGTSWGSFLAAWLTEWERTGDTHWRDRILAGMNSLAKLKRGWFAGGAPFDLQSGVFLGAGDHIGISHLNCVFGIFEIQAELFVLLDAPAYKQVWLDYCRYYNAPDAALKAFLGEIPPGRSLRVAHSRLTAYAAHEAKDAALAKRAWKEFSEDDFGEARLDANLHHLQGPDVLRPIDEDPSISTNGAAQWSLAAIANLALIGAAL